MAKRSIEIKREEEEEYETEDEYENDDIVDYEGIEEEEEEDRRKRALLRIVSGRGVPSNNTLRCQADDCGLDLRAAKRYHRRHKVCERHAKAAFVSLAGIDQRFCQQCSRFHEVCQFDDTKRSCRKRLAGHNQRRRKNQHRPETETTTQAR